MLELPESVSLNTALILGMVGMALGIIVVAIVATWGRKRQPSKLEALRRERDGLAVELEKAQKQVKQGTPGQRTPWWLRPIEWARALMERQQKAADVRDKAARALEDKDIPEEIDPRLVARIGAPLRHLPVTIYILFIFISIVVWMVLLVFSLFFGPILIVLAGIIGMFLMAAPNLLQFRMSRIINREDKEASKFHIIPSHPAIVQFLAFRRKVEHITVGPVQMNGQVHYLLGPASLPYVKIGKRVFRIPRPGAHDGTWTLQTPEGTRLLLYPPGLSEPFRQPGYNEEVYEDMKRVADEMARQQAAAAKGGENGEEPK